MFERYTEKARRAIFGAVYMARRVGSPMIETEHLLLGLLREDKSLTGRFLGSPWAAETVWKRIEQIKPRMEEAIAANDYTKDEACLDEEGKERDNLYLLYRKYGLTDWIFD